jgi:hypothetical protein
MSIIIKLLGYTVEEDDKKYLYIIYIKYIECFSYNMIKKYFIDKNFNEELLDGTIKFLYNAIDITNKNDELFNIEDGKTGFINIYTNDIQYKNKLIHFFLINGIKYPFNSSIKIENKIENKVEEIIIPEKINKLSDEQLNENNNNFFKLLEDLDLLKLIEIYENKPELFKILYLINSNYNIINENNETNEINEECFNKLKILFHTTSDECIIDALKKNNNICSLAFRYLLKNR